MLLKQSEIDQIIWLRSF